MAAYTGKAITGNRIKNNGATVINGGAANTNGSTVTNVISVHSLLAATNRQGNQNSTTTSYKAKAVSAGRMGKMEAGYYVIMTYAPKIYGSASTLLLNPGNHASWNKSFNSIRTITTTRSVTAGWNYATGAYLSGPTTASDDFGADAAIAVGRSPLTNGKIVYTATSLANKEVLSTQIVRTNYERKTG